MKEGKIIIAPNAFKGALSAEEAAQAIAKGIRKSGIKNEMVELPIADGGDGSLTVISKYLEAEIIASNVKGPDGKAVEANWGYNKSKNLAIIEMAEASGIRLLPKNELNPMVMSTYGTGQLIQEAVNLGARQIYLTVGGSATVDLGVGIMEALGARFYIGSELLNGIKPKDFKRITSIDLTALRELKSRVSVRILSDVNNPLLGKEGAAAVFGPQKGANEEMVEQLESVLDHLAGMLEELSGKSVRNLKGGGAAGGITAGLYLAMDAEILDGADQILNWAGFKEHLKSASLVITGEGKIDTQTNYGKGPGLIARLAKEADVKVIGLSGALDEDTSQIKNFDQLIAISDPNDPLEASMRKTADNLEKSVSQMRTWSSYDSDT
ncbi:MAG: glycerate kinase [Cyclobacteriaceae bacterium]